MRSPLLGPAARDEGLDEEIQRVELPEVIDDEIQQLELPGEFIRKATRDLFGKHDFLSDKTSMADYCGPCHTLARWACVALLASEAIGVFLGWLTNFAIWQIVLLLQPFNLGMLVLEWRCLKYVLLPWQIRLLRNGSVNFQLPLPSQLFDTGFFEWAWWNSFVSLVVVVSLQNQAVHTGRAFQHTTDLYHIRGISGLCFMATLVSLVWVIVWSQPVCNEVVKWDFDRDRSNPQREREEIRYTTMAYMLGLSKWPNSHYESLIRYAQYAGMVGIQQMTNSLQGAEASLLWYTVPEFERKCSTRIQMVMRFNFAMVFCRVLLRTVPQVCLSTLQYHEHWQSWWTLWPLGVNLFVFISSDMATFLTAEGIYGDFTDRLLEDRELEEYDGECKKMMKSSRRFHGLRLPLMALSTSLISLCASLVVSDWICQPFLVYEFTCTAHQHHHLLAAVVFLGVFLFLMAISFFFFCWYLKEPLVLFEPAPRLDGKKLYVDEDKPEYYLHKPGAFEFMMVRNRTKIFTHHGSREHHTNLSLEGVEADEAQFKDNKLLRVQQPGQQGDIPKLTAERKHMLLGLAPDAAKEHWFELALRFGKELTPRQWRKEVDKCPKRKMVKLLGFNGEATLSSSYGVFFKATQQLVKNFDVVLWEGDWYSSEGWTGMIETFLTAKPNAKAVAFQKRAEVPGFHRSYYRLYQEFPNRIQIVVLRDSDEAYQIPKPILQKQEWIKGEIIAKRLLQPEPQRWLTVGLVARKFQGDEVPVIAMNGGKITTALAAVDTRDNQFQKIHWTVYEAWKVDKEPWRVDEETREKTLFDYADEHSNAHLTLVRMRRPQA